MAETWWSWGQAVHYLLSHRPCDNLIAARQLLESNVVGGTMLAARYRTKGGEVCMPIERHEWRGPSPSTNRIASLPFRLPELLEAIALGRPVYVLEGEKDVENARSKIGIAATCNACGAGKWHARQPRT